MFVVKDTTTVSSPPLDTVCAYAIQLRTSIGVYICHMGFLGARALQRIRLRALTPVGCRDHFLVMFDPFMYHGDRLFSEYFWSLHSN